MSDFIFNRQPVQYGSLSNIISSIYSVAPPKIFEYHGKWGSLAVSQNVYTGFDPYETKHHILVIIGGPVLSFCDNSSLTSSDHNAGTKAIYERWISSNQIKWDMDLLGPFTALFIDKTNGELTVVTDIMSFIPVFASSFDEKLIISTHIDMAAKAAEKEADWDIISVADFILSGVVTYPYTCYSNFRQIAPAAVHKWQSCRCEAKSQSYWIPTEKKGYSTIAEAGAAVQTSLKEYVGKVTKNMKKVGLFISGGEDSRVVLGILPKDISKDGFIFLEGMNREGKISRKAAKIYGAKLNMYARESTHYLDILPECSDIIGSGSQYGHIHAYLFHKLCGLNSYSAVFGGFLSDTFLKGHKIAKIGACYRFPFLPEIKQRKDHYCDPVSNNFLYDDILEKISARRRHHYDYIKQLRPNSADEWVGLWPMSMQGDIPHINGHRHLFRSYEPFTSPAIVKIAACVPQSWKLNRRLFRIAAKPFLKPSKWLVHTDGRLPYFQWYFNLPLQFIRKVCNKFRKVFHPYTIPQYAWYDEEKLLASKKAKELESQYNMQLEYLSRILVKNKNDKLINLLTNPVQKRNLLQVAYILYKNQTCERTILEKV